MSVFERSNLIKVNLITASFFKIFIMDFFVLQQTGKVAFAKVDCDKESKYCYKYNNICCVLSFLEFVYFMQLSIDEH